MAVPKGGANILRRVMLPGMALFAALKVAEVLLWHRPLVSAKWLLLFPLVGIVLWGSASFRTRKLHLPRLIAALIVPLVGIGVATLGLQLLLTPRVPDVHGRDSFLYTLDQWVVATVWLLCGVSFSRINPLGWRAASAFAALFMSALLVLAVLGLVELDLQRVALLMGLERVTHLFIADYIVFLVMLVYGSRRDVLGFIGISSGLLLLLLIPSRSSLMISLLVIVFYELWWWGGGGKFLLHRLKRLLVLLVGGLLGAVLIIASGLGRQSGVTRVVDLILRPEESGSFKARVEAFAVGLNSLNEQLWIGNPAIIVRDFGDLGMQMHNAMSAWQFHGLLYFGILSALTILVLRRLATNRHNPTLVPTAHRVFCVLFLHSAIALFAARGYAMPLFWFALGFWLVTPGVPSTWLKQSWVWRANATAIK